MSQRRQRQVCWGVISTLVVGWLLTGNVARAVAQPRGGQFEAHLAAGEFVPALALARAAHTQQERDAMLAQVAQAQSRSGLREAAVRTAGEIYDDRARATVLGEIQTEPLGGRGGAANADFDSLIDLIKKTVAPTSWDDAGGPGSIQRMPAGVYVDPQGVLGPRLREERGSKLAALRGARAPSQGTAHGEARRESPLRMVSLPRLEKQVHLHLAAGEPLGEEIRYLAGLRRIQYVFVYPESRDLVIAGPAGDWTIGVEDRVLSMATGEPVVHLDDLVVVFRHMLAAPDAKFGCLIVPTQDGLARLKAFVEESNKRPIHPSQRRSWLEKLRSQLGLQEIEVYGLDPRTRAARVMVEADYRMKLVGMGLEEGVPGLESYLDSIKLRPGEPPPPMGVLRWWFTLNYDAVVADCDRRAFAIRGQGVKVLSENEHLTALGQRIHTGKADALNEKFARDFTAHFEALCRKYPVYAELRNLFDLALVAALLRAEDLPAKTDWHMVCFRSPQFYQVELGPAPKKVETVINHRVVHGTTILAGVSGGVQCDPTALVSPRAVQTERDRTVAGQHSRATPKPLPPEAWWWD
jgi:hypothetical protein